MTKQPVMSASEIKRLRKELQLTQEDLANQIGSRVATISRWEHGHCKVSPQYNRILRSLAKEKGEGCHALRDVSH